MKTIITSFTTRFAGTKNFLPRFVRAKNISSLRRTIITLLFAGTALVSQAQIVFSGSRFDSIANQVVPVGGYLNASGKSVEGFFESNNLQFPNVYSTAYDGYWVSGWAYSNIQNDTIGGFTNLYTAYAAKGNNNSANYAIGQAGSVLRNNSGDTIFGLYATNGTYAALSMKDGDFVAKKFGGISGNDNDSFVLTIKAWKNGTLKTDSVNFFLADYRFANNAQDYIVKDWTFIDLQLLGKVDSLLFEMSSSDNGDWGMNTPAFFCVDDVVRNNDTADIEDLNLAPGTYWNKTETTFNEIYTDAYSKLEFPSAYNVSAYGDYWSSGYAISNVFDTVTSGDKNMYSTYAGGAYGGSRNFAVVQNYSKVIIKPITSDVPYPVGMYVTNTTYAALSMKNGDLFAKKFGGANGDDPDYFLLTVKGYLNGSVKLDSVNFYLADYRDADNSKDYIVKDWTGVNLSSIGGVDSIEFVLSSSDNSVWGMNTPAFFALGELDVVLDVSVEEINKQLSFAVYPNPAQDFVQIKTEAKNSTVRLLDVAGREVSTHNIRNEEKISTAHLPAGLYWVEVSNEKGRGVKKLIKN